ncbi:MAG: HNH endonuclease [Planctomycetaceae bacterium]
MANALRNTAADQSGNRCEYCQLTGLFQVRGFEADHIIPRSCGGTTTPSNIAYACPLCNGRKRNYQDGRDPQTGKMVTLFNPRRDVWHDHFEWSVDARFMLIGKTPCGRATIARLAMNDTEMLRLRSLLAEAGYDCRKTDFD